MCFNFGANKRECLMPLQFWGSPSQSNLHAIVSGRSITLPDIRTTDPGVNVSNIEMTRGMTGIVNDNTAIQQVNNKNENILVILFLFDLTYIIFASYSSGILWHNWTFSRWC